MEKLQATLLTINSLFCPEFEWMVKFQKRGSDKRVLLTLLNFFQPPSLIGVKMEN